MYLQFEPIAGSALGVAADLTRLQLNARFAPVDDDERALQAVYSSVVNALEGKQQAATTAAVSELNVLLSR
jgi:hypothetical protein